jgi:membrane protein YqaA with SNARE-associated domain
VSTAFLGILGILFLDGATLGAVTTPLLVSAGKTYSPWLLAGLGGLASALGAAVQLRVLVWLLDARRGWARRWAPSQHRLEEALTRYRRATFLGLVLVRATPVPDLPLKLVAAAGRYPIPLYAAAVWLGALPYYFVLAELGQWLQPPLWAIVAGVAVVAGIGFLEGRRRARREARRRAPTG